MISILYVEDDQEIGQWVKVDLQKRGYVVRWVLTGEEALNYAEQADIVILDVMLPALDGFSVGKRIKKEYTDIPILMLSARGSVDDKLQGLEFADDYLTKPFHLEELVARIMVLIRRHKKDVPQMIECQHLNIYLNENRIENKVTNQELILTGKQYAIFEYLLRNAGQILTKEQIYEGVWGDMYIEGDKTLMVHIRYLREKLELNPAKPTIIETIRGLGYRIKI